MLIKWTYTDIAFCFVYRKCFAYVADGTLFFKQYLSPDIKWKSFIWSIVKDASKMDSIFSTASLNQKYYCCQIWAGVPSFHLPVLKEFKCVYGALIVVVGNYFPPSSSFRKDKMSLASRCFIAISMASDLVSFIL